ncbi:hypothetical protein OG393_18865 [Streptomyces sp. NBC_01216]|uniref:hypothetical protein n=1 Tax=Streptomyces sp. NBC_01216 TaxID=2903778 RepID=UPI002E11C4D3|nr:hypothetical protein OG393_18865 [Streptomyces sp. NBC_01216]
MLAITNEGDTLSPDQAAALLCSGVLAPGSEWVAPALATKIPCRVCGRRLRVVLVRGTDGSVAVDGEGCLVFGSGSVSRDALGVLCDGCYELAGWENTHNDEGHEEKPDPDCPLCGVASPA